MLHNAWNNGHNNNYYEEINGNSKNNFKFP